MQKPCEDWAKPRGLEIETRSGFGPQTICDLSQSNDVRHVVRILNKRTYRLDIVCKGLINSNPRKVEFSSPNTPPDTPTSWSATISLLDGEEYTFDHVSLVCLTQGTDNVHTEVIANWSQSLKKTVVPLGFQVKAC